MLSISFRGIAVAKRRTPSAAVLVNKKIIDANDLVFPPNLFSRKVYAVFNSPVLYAGKRTEATIIRPMRYPKVTWRKLRLVKYARPGIDMNVNVLVSAATIEKQTAHHGISFEPRK